MERGQRESQLDVRDGLAIDETTPVIDYEPGHERETSFPEGAAADVSPPPLITPGEYEARSTKLLTRRLWGQPRIILVCELVGGEHDGLNLSWYATPLPRRGRIPASSKMWRAICLTLNRRPTRHEHVSERLLLHHLFRVRVKTIVRDHAGRSLPPAAHYSVIADLLERLA